MGTDLPAAGVDRPDPEAFGRALGPGLGVNLMMRDVAAAARFQADVFGASVAYHDEDFAILRHHGTVWMLHRDRTYRAHPFRGVFEPAETRGAGVELRLYGCDPDAAAARAESAGGILLDAPADKPHGLRECFIACPEGYVWVPSTPKTGAGQP